MNFFFPWGYSTPLCSCTIICLLFFVFWKDGEEVVDLKIVIIEIFN